MSAKDWRFIVQDLTTGTFLHWDLPVSGSSITKAMNGPGRLSGTVPLFSGIRDLLIPWRVAVWAEYGGQILGGGVLVNVTLSESNATLDVMGLSGYPNGQVYTGPSRTYTGADSAAVFRFIWVWLQEQPGGNLGVSVGGGLSGKLIGSAEEPYRMSWYENSDLGQVVTGLEGFEFVEETSWNGDALSHRIRLGVPRLGAKKSHLRFVIGENVTISPSVALGGDDYASEVLVIGAGEGSAQVRATVPGRRTGLRRSVSVSAKELTTTDLATAHGREEVQHRSVDPSIDSITIREHPNAPLNSISVGDEIYISGPWFDKWVRVTDMTINPEQFGVASLRLSE